MASVGVARIPDTVAEIVVSRSVKLVSARFGDNLDAAIAQLVVFRGERILIDPNFPDGILRGKLTCAKAVDENRAAAWSPRTVLPELANPSLSPQDRRRAPSNPHL